MTNVGELTLSSRHCVSPIPTTKESYFELHIPDATDNPNGRYLLYSGLFLLINNKSLPPLFPAGPLFNFVVRFLTNEKRVEGAKLVLIKFCPSSNSRLSIFQPYETLVLISDILIFFASTPGIIEVNLLNKDCLIA